MVLCEIPAQKDSVLRFAMPAELLDLLRMFDGRRNVAEVFAAYDKLNPGKFSLPKLEQLVQSFLLPKSLLVDQATPAFLPEISSNRASYVYAKVRLIRDIVYPIAKLFGWAFDKRVLILWLAIFVFDACDVLSLGAARTSHAPERHHGLDIFNRDVTQPRGCVYSRDGACLGARLQWMRRKLKSAFGIYIYYPVLYTDVSKAWKLSRQRRALIDVGGVYFQSVFQFLLLSLFFVSGSPILIYFFLFNDLIMFRRCFCGWTAIAGSRSFRHLQPARTIYEAYQVLRAQAVQLRRAGKRRCRFFRDEQGSLSQCIPCSQLLSFTSPRS